MASAPSIVSWSVIVTKSIPRRLARAWTSSGGVAHSGRPSAFWTPSLATAEAVEWQCRSTRLVVVFASLIAHGASTTFAGIL